MPPESCRPHCPSRTRNRNQELTILFHRRLQRGLLRSSQRTDRFRFDPHGMAGDRALPGPRHDARIFRCPSDKVLSSLQRKSGWSERSRSISMNAMVGDAGAFTHGGTNLNNPLYRQYLRLGQFYSAAKIFIFIEEHPDSINDGYFLNKGYDTEGRAEWTDLPASYHHGAANLSFADGHVEIHRWLAASTKRPLKADAARLPFLIPEDEEADFDWLLQRTSTPRR